MRASLSIELVSSSARVTSVKSAKGLSLSFRDSNPSIRPAIPGSDKNVYFVSGQDTKVGEKSASQTWYFPYQKLYVFHALVLALCFLMCLFNSLGILQA